MPGQRGGTNPARHRDHLRRRRKSRPFDRHPEPLCSRRCAYPRDFAGEPRAGRRPQPRVRRGGGGVRPLRRFRRLDRCGLLRAALRSGPGDGGRRGVRLDAEDTPLVFEMDDPLYRTAGGGRRAGEIPRLPLSARFLRDEQAPAPGDAAAAGAAFPRKGLLRGCRIHDARAV